MELTWKVVYQDGTEKPGSMNGSSGNAMKGGLETAYDYLVNDRIVYYPKSTFALMNNGLEIWRGSKGNVPPRPSIRRPRRFRT